MFHLFCCWDYTAYALQFSGGYIVCFYFNRSVCSAKEKLSKSKLLISGTMDLQKSILALEPMRWCLNNGFQCLFCWYGAFAINSNCLVRSFRQFLLNRLLTALIMSRVTLGMWNSLYLLRGGCFVIGCHKYLQQKINRNSSEWQTISLAWIKSAA